MPTPHKARSAALLSMFRSSSSVYRSSATQFDNTY